MHPKLYSLMDRRPKKTFSEKSPSPLNLLKQHQGHQTPNSTPNAQLQPSTACLLGNQTNEITHIRFVHQHVDPLEARTVGVSCISKTFQDDLKPIKKWGVYRLYKRLINETYGPKMVKSWGEAAELAKVVLYILESWNTFWDNPAPYYKPHPQISSTRKRIESTCSACQIHPGIEFLSFSRNIFDVHTWKFQWPTLFRTPLPHGVVKYELLKGNIKILAIVDRLMDN